ncbi:MAG: cyclic beta 1-2 glucan synthetase [Proteobacteria bacterium]|nr:cyclic beta 1-2 glucan synthetase [Pseudomonadota bacterium]
MKKISSAKHLITEQRSSEPLSIEQMEKHALVLAKSHQLAAKTTGGILLKRLAASEQTLLKAREILLEVTSSHHRITPAGAWLLDNFYLIEEQIRMIKRHLPKNYERDLPQLTGGCFEKGYPRIYDIALQVIEHSDGSWNLANLNRFIRTYQTITPLKLGELWALPIMIRSALIENLSHVSAQIIDNWNGHKLANYWADKVLEAAIAQPKKLVLVIADMVRSEPPMIKAFVAEFSRRLQNASLPMPLTWIQQELAEEGKTIEQLVEAENTQQALNQVTVSNSLASLRQVSDTDWREFVEKVSVIEQILRKDPAAIYAHMDFTSRDLYRHIVEKLARSTHHSETEVAAAALETAQNAQVDTTDQRKHIGYYLAGEGYADFKQYLKGNEKPTIKDSWTELALVKYFGFITLSTLILTGLLVYQAKLTGIGLVWAPVLAIALGLAISQFTLEMTNWILMLFTKPRPLPKLDFSKGIPQQYRTLIVVPALLGNLQDIESLVESLEVRFLGNREQHLSFALLTDFNDAPCEQMENDQLLLVAARDSINSLNRFYRTGDEDIFFLLHRPRKWNSSEQVWMGYERKRGKLNDLNALIKQKVRSNFSLIVGDTSFFHEIKYVITLDTDTQLPRQTARQLVGAMAHPLNRPHYDPEKQRVTSGYGILQPLIGEAMGNAHNSRYIWLCGNESGIDPYTRTVSNLYQDLFQEGSFTGKGIYDVDCFQTALAARFPENLILSHDLLEGCYLRAGFLSDVPVVEHSPSQYLADVKRRKRWVRGDWQLLQWLFPKVPTPNKDKIKNPLSALSKWKIFDNLRRSLVAPALMLLFFLSWTVAPRPHFFWFELIIAIMGLPTVLTTLYELLRKPKDVLIHQHLALLRTDTFRKIYRLIFYIACLPHEAWYSLDSIFRSCWRMFCTHRHLLEWAPSNQIERQIKDNPSALLKRLWVAPFFGIAGAMVLIANGEYWMLMLSSWVLALWILAPFFAHLVSRPILEKQSVLNEEQSRFLRKMARKAWDYFDTFVTEQDHWLPPDNYQEGPVELLTHRTSPTNIGLSLLANLSAFDFGYITSRQLLERTSNTFKTLSQLERYRGHFYNWYDTQTLEPLRPRYVSTVDDGNLAGHLLTLRQGLLEIIDAPVLHTRYLDGLEDTAEVLKETANFSKDSLNAFLELLTEARAQFISWPNAIRSVEALCTAAEQIAIELLQPWSQKLLLQCYALREELKLLAPVNDLAGSISASRLAMIENLVEQAFAFAQMDMNFLYNPARGLMAIGYNVDNQTLDRNEYDLLASEARLASFVAIAQGQAPQESWFALGRMQVVSRQGQMIMMSWSGSMFEYLMPLIVMPSYPNTLLDQACRSAVSKQIEYGIHRGVPWGISESGYHAVDINLQYQYRAFGVPELGFKRGLEDDLVVAPYATVLALMLEPEAACMNLQRLLAEESSGRFGFYEAIDYTPSRLPRHSSRAVVRSFMAHHQGMSLLSFSHRLHNQPMQKRFIADPLFQATLLLLQERIPKPVSWHYKKPLAARGLPSLNSPKLSTRVYHHPNTPSPQVQLLSNGRYHVLLTAAGAGYSRWKDIVLTRWREDSTCDPWGFFCYIRELKSGEFWSTTYQPTRVRGENFKTVFSDGCVEFSNTHNDLEIHTKIVVSPEDDIELRRTKIQNRSKSKKTIDFTSYAEVVLSHQNDDLAQPAFNNLFVETELLTQQQAILVSRRPRSEQQNPVWMCHKLNIYTEKNYQVSFETNRNLFLGRGNTLAAPEALTKDGNLSNSSGIVLDPIMAIRGRITLEPGSTLTFDLINGAADSREQCLTLIQKYRDRHWVDRIFGLSGAHSQIFLRQLNLTESEAQLYEKLASAIVYSTKYRRADPSIVAQNRYGQSKLWGYSISGDLPIVLLRIEEVENIDLARQMIQAQAYWRRKGLRVDLVILNEERSGYRQNLQEQLITLVNAQVGSQYMGSIFVRIAEQMPMEDRILFQSIARVVITDRDGPLKNQLYRRQVNALKTPLLKKHKIPRYGLSEKIELPKNLLFFNGLGGFNAEGQEYWIHLKTAMVTPAPWCNVLANPHFGSLVSESGQGYTWYENSHEFRLTPWNNDPVQDAGGEAFYIRDEQTAEYWSPTPLPCRGSGDYLIRHGFGYSIFEHRQSGIYSELRMYVALNSPVKYFVLSIRNETAQKRNLSALGYVEWVLGDLRSKFASQIVTNISSTGVLLAQNFYNTELGERTAFFNAATARSGLLSRSATCSRIEFIGRNRSLQQPIALERVQLSGRSGAELDPCAAIQLNFELNSKQTREIIFILGAASNQEQAEQTARAHCSSAIAEESLQSIREYWRNSLGAVQVATPDPAVNIMANGWLLYQVISSRLWGRTGYYQSSGAFGFRDQLQDVLSLVHSQPQLLREQILLCASRQFVEGDVQHWWHPPHGRGVRTRCSDDYLWLPYAICRYIETTGDMAILNQQIAFLEGRPLNPEEESYYELPNISQETATVYQHGVRAILHGLRWGAHGLPLMGSGDWNDGMNLVGVAGRGESVWLGFFLYNILKKFSLLAHAAGDMEFAQLCQQEYYQLRDNLEKNGWDGEWYLRAYFDDGSPLGSVNNSECRIDSIAQSWGVLSGAADPARARQAMAAVNHFLVRPEDSLIALLDPPFNHSQPNPGYIKGYVPGIRENGGQYTHAAAWVCMAYAKLGESQLAWQLFNMLNPVNHGCTPEALNRYKIEPYVVAGDIYSVGSLAGRGGWSWYTGSAGWMYQLLIESLLGLHLHEGHQLRLTPRLPDGWDQFTVAYRYKSSWYQIEVRRDRLESIKLDGVELHQNRINLVDDGKQHFVVLILPIE